MARPAIIATTATPLPEHELLARAFRVLGDATRLRILELLLEAGELRQSDIITRIGVMQSRASEHLSCLVWCGFVESERTGRSVRYRIADERAADFIQLARAFLSDNRAAIGSCHTLDNRRLGAVAGLRD
jgi:DNA-binding transcriptional ArsR family regulator